MFSLIAYRGYLDEAPADNGGGGSSSDVTIDIDKVSDQMGADLGLSDDKSNDDKSSGSATPPDGKTSDAGSAPSDAAAKAAAEKATKVAEAKTALQAKQVDLTGKSDDEILALANPKRSAPKSWKQEMHAHYDKATKELQDYIDQRETEVEQGIQQHAKASEYGRNIAKVLEPYQALLTQQGVTDHAKGVQYLMHAHYMLSTAPEDKRAEFFANLARSYKVDPAKFAAAMQVQVNQPQETAAERANRERIEKLENERKADQQARYEAVKADVDKELAAFAADPAHPHFKEVQQEMALLLQDPNVSLKDAYDRAVWANPVTRAKEQARLQTEAEAKAKKEADDKAAAALAAKGTRVKGDERHRASPDLLGSMDDTMRQTFREIQTRQE